MRRTLLRTRPERIAAYSARERPAILPWIAGRVMFVRMDPADIQAWQRIVGAAPDGNPGPATHAATIAWFRDHGYIKPPALPSDARARVVAIAQGELGDRDPDKYWRLVQPALMGHPHDVAWCGGFALWCLRMAGLCDWSWKIGSGFLEIKGLPKISLPEPGDIGYLAKNAHHFIVEDVHDGKVFSIDGNHLAPPREGVGAAVRLLGDVTTFYSIRNLVPT